jgi:hypothetical protein
MATVANAPTEGSTPQPTTPLPKEVEDEMVGLWARRRMTCGDQVDESTIVYYLQTKSGIFADIRVPADCIQILTNGLDLASLTDTDMLQLSRMKGFGGVFLCDFSTWICQWHREIDYQPVAPAEEYLPDESNFRIEDNGRILVETGIHEEFEEIWERVTPLGTATQAFRLVTEANSHLESRTSQGKRGILVTVADYFLVIVDHDGGVDALPRASDLYTLIQGDLQAGDRVSANQKLEHVVVEFGKIVRTTEEKIVSQVHAPHTFFETEHTQDAVYMVKYSTKQGATGKPSETIPRYKWACVGV